MITFSRATQLVKMLGARHARIATAICLCLTGSAVPLNAQNSVVFGNAVITPGLQSQGFTITTSVNQTDTTSSVTYNITPPDNYVVNTETIVGQIGIQFLVPAGSQASGTATITYTGWANVLGAASGGFFASGGYNGGAGPQMVNFSTAAGAGTLSFYIAGTTIGGSQPAPASSITISLDIGNPRHGRKAYLNDYLGMGKTNYAIWRPSEGNWYLDLINQPSVVAQWGEPGDVPAPGDYDGDGITDLAVWRPSDQVWYIILSGSGQPIGVQWGLPGDIPIIGADYDGDGRTDLAIWRPSDGTWWVQFSSTGEVVVTQWGVPGDVPLVGDFNGDG
ncbi:MAG: VCBS repeat-containing protein, partial [Acidobacteriaceae bacterium]|nr:VCBS repeat-containing protein [Acidobacteriaceae bacterium]